MALNSIGLEEVVTSRGSDGAEADPCLAFGPFVLYPQQYMLLRGGEPVNLGSRALSLLVALATRPGELVEKHELLSLVWPKAVVEECNLRAQVVALRRALGENDDFGYIVTVPGRGYRFIAPVSQPALEPAAAALPMAPASLPNLATRVIGRDEVIQGLTEQLLRRRFVTLTGPGGVGKTTVALAAANCLREAFSLGSAFVDLAAAASAYQVQGMLANALGISVPGQAPLLQVAPNESGRFLLVLDNCEHVLDHLAGAVETLLQQGPQYFVLVSSREPLHAEGEYVQDLPPLAAPAPRSGLGIKQAMAYPGVELFIKRVATHDPDFVFQDADVDAVAAICRKLDGNALAIEIAAARARAFGVHDLVELLDSSFRLQMTGRRTALPRHRTLSATLDWTYAMLSEHEQAMLRQLAVFNGCFSLETVKAVVDIEPQPAFEVAPALESLVGKSLLTAFEHQQGKRYRLLETTRLYALEKLNQHGEAAHIGYRHAHHVKAQLTEALALLDRLPPGKWLARHASEIDSVRTALQWAFAEGGEVALGVELTLLSAPLWLRLSLLGECQAWIEQGLQRVDEGEAQPGTRMVLRTFAASILTLTHGGGPRVRQAWEGVLADAELLADSQHQLRALWGLWNDRVCCNQHVEALALAKRYLALSQRDHVEDRQLMGKRMLAIALFYQADLAGARQAIGEALSSPFAPRSHIIDVHFDQRLAARALKAQVQMLEGNLGQALVTLDSYLGDAINLNHPATLWYCLCYSALPVALLAGSEHKAGEYLGLLKGSITSQELPLWWRYSQCFECVVQLRKQVREDTVAQLGELLGALREQNDTPLYSLFSSEYVQALGALGLPQWGLDALEQTLARVCERQERWFLPELLRVKAALLQQAQGNAGREAALATLEQAREAAQAQGAVFWLSRIETDLARLQGPRRAGLANERGSLERAG
ncbi:winged helix-turn-helix domain-containing protein [Pseudomonas sp. NPDC007930]|uniref:ATP-binding protein n=1 Tax=Pseudomonas sp. NPDC007930 TaxID=3364417 RepID=UPI0036E5F346